ncbi:hypothetical protein L596_008355 [Steinernema carpocapsae]|uniref:Uncharacterized protein n=1 Tax=Steinernema carpocapsae TaxID=34508 RepID=A0A4U5PCR1_STECR|nr:hypothetical protein L596_008355 [Steinernema carpocapsae]
MRDRGFEILIQGESLTLGGNLKHFPSIESLFLFNPCSFRVFYKSMLFETSPRLSEPDPLTCFQKQNTPTPLSYESAKGQQFHPPGAII